MFEMFLSSHDDSEKSARWVQCYLFFSKDTGLLEGTKHIMKIFYSMVPWLQTLIMYVILYSTVFCRKMGW